jgi:hypothetical protein
VLVLPEEGPLELRRRQGSDGMSHLVRQEHWHEQLFKLVRAQLLHLQPHHVRLYTQAQSPRP